MPLTYETNDKNSSLKKVNTNYQKDFISSSTQNLNLNNNIKDLNNKKIKDRNSSLANRNSNIDFREKNHMTNAINKNYNTNTNDIIQNKNMNRSVIISDDKKITLDLLMEEAKKRYNKNKLNQNENNKNKLQQFYAEHLNKNINKGNLFNNYAFDNKLNNNVNDINNKNYDCPEKNLNLKNNKKIPNFIIESKEKVNNYDKFNIKQSTKNDIR